MKVRLLFTSALVVLFIGCEKDPASPAVTTTTYTWSSVETFTNADCSGDAITGHCMTDMTLTEPDCGDGWMDLFTYLTTAFGSISCTLKSDNTAIYSVTNAEGTSEVPCTFTESNNTITVTLSAEQVLEFTRDGDSLRQIVEAEDNASGCTQFIYTM